jgi:U3 small nucleolar RNA-associated protein 6
MNLDLLRRKRIKRLGVKSPLHSGQRRIYSILDRATKRFQGDLGLWMQYIEYARHCKAHKKVEELMTRCLRFHPTKPELWVYAATFALDNNGDMRAARGYMQRGLRFCERSKMLWVEYGKLEMIYVAKLAGRRRILGLDGLNAKSEETVPQEEDPNADTIALPTVTAEDINPRLAADADANETALRNLESAPVLTGAIPIAIFDAAMNKFGSHVQLAQQFFDAFAEFDQVPSLKNILQHILDVLRGSSPKAAAMVSFKLPVCGLNLSSPEFPAALGQSIALINGAIDEMPGQQVDIAANAITWMLRFHRGKHVDESLKKVISSSLRRYSKCLDKVHFLRLAKELQSDKRKNDAELLLKIGTKYFGGEEEFIQMQSSLETSKE